MSNQDRTLGVTLIGLLAGRGNGNDDNAGTKEAPFATVGKGRAPTLSSRDACLWLLLAIGTLGGCGGDSLTRPSDGAVVVDASAVADGGNPVDADSPDTDAGVRVLALGTATGSPLANCPAGTFPGATCMTVAVTCPGTAPDTATLAINQPTGTPVGTVMLMAGGGGTTFFSIDNYTNYLAANFRLVEVAWQSAWPQASPASALNGACRAATLSRFVYDNIHGGAAVQHSAGFCGLGISGGGAFFAYSLAHYGLKNIFDYLEILSGPSVSKLDYGCDPSLYQGGPRYLCPLLPNPSFAFTPPTNTEINGMEGTHTCGADGGVDPSDIAKWTADSIVSPGADYDYPQTGISFWFCGGTMLNESSGLGSFLVEKVQPLGQPPVVNCYSQCTGENVLGDPNAKTASVSSMVAGCIPRH